MRRVPRSFLARALSAALVLLPIAACSGDKAKAKGQIMLALQTDMSIPADVSHVRILVFKNGGLKFDQKYAVGPGGEEIPATLGLIASDNPQDTVEVRVLAYRANTVRTLNRAVTTIPQDRVATLRVPIQWLCDEQVAPTPGVPDSYESSCPDPGQACIAGECRDVQIAEANLPDFRPEEITGGSADPARGLCFETAACLDAGRDVPVESDCTIRVAEATVSRLNVGLVLPPEAGGICSESSSTCYIPLDKSADYGWRVLPGPVDPPSGGGAGGEPSELGGAGGASGSGPYVAVQLPSAVCQRLSEGKATAVRASVVCATKTEANPTCGPWTSVGTRNPNVGPGGGGAGPGPIPRPENPECPALYTASPGSGEIASDPEVNRYAHLVLEFASYVDRLRVDLGESCSRITEHLAGETANFVGEVPTDAELSDLCGRAQAYIGEAPEVHLTLGDGHCRASVTDQLAAESECPAISGCEIGTEAERCGAELSTCDGPCSGVCLPGPSSLELGCEGVCFGRCTGDCNSSCTGPDGNPLPPDSCLGYCSGTCSGTCQGSCSGSGSCAGACRGSCEGTVRERLCENPLDVPSCALMTSCFNFAAAEAALRQECVGPGVFVQGPAEEDILPALNEGLPRLLHVIEQSQGLSLALSSLASAASVLSPRFLDATTNSGCLLEATTVLSNSGSGLATVLTEAQLVLASAESGGLPATSCAAEPGDDSCTSCTKASCCFEYEGCWASSRCVSEVSCVRSCRERGEPPALCESQCASMDGALDPLARAVLDCSSNTCTSCLAPVTPTCTSTGTDGLAIDDFDDADTDAPLGIWRLANRAGFAGTLSLVMPGANESAAALGAIGTPQPGLALDFRRCVEAFQSSGISFSLSGSTSQQPLMVEVRLRVRATESPDLGGDCQGARCGDHYRARITPESTGFERFTLIWADFFDSGENNPDPVDAVGLDFVALGAADRLVIDDVVFDPFSATGQIDAGVD